MVGYENCFYVQDGYEIFSNCAKLSFALVPRIKSDHPLRFEILSRGLSPVLPEYTRHPITQLEHSTCSLREQHVIGQIRARTERFINSFYQIV